MAFNDEPLSRPTTLEEIAAALNRVREGMRRAQYSDLTAELPDVIHGLHVLTADAPAGHHLEEIYSTLAYAYNRASSFAYRYGYLDLAGLAAERCMWAAERSGDPIWPIAAEYHRALILLYSGAPTPAGSKSSTAPTPPATNFPPRLTFSRSGVRCICADPSCRPERSTVTPWTRICGRHAGSAK